jgi:hypothetical protein
MPSEYKVERLKRRPYGDAESESVSVRMCLWHKHHVASYHRIIPHSITSYIMSHQHQELSTKQTFGSYMMNESVPEHEANLRQLQSYQENFCRQQYHTIALLYKGFFLYEA